MGKHFLQRKKIDSQHFFYVNKRNLIVLHDLMVQSGKDRRIADLFTKGSHHKNLSVIYIVQNIFHQGRETRDISLNTHYIVLFKSPRDKQQISTLARQIRPGRVQEFMNAFEEATSRPHGYLMLDLKPTTHDDQRLKTNVLPGHAGGIQQQLSGYIRKQTYRQPPLLNAVYNTEQRMENILSSPSMTPNEKSALYANEYHRFQSFQNQLQNKFQNRLENKLTKFLKHVTKNIKKVVNKQRSYQRYSQADDADIEDSDSDESNQPRKKYSRYRDDSDAEDDGSDVTDEPGETEEEISDLDEGTERNQRRASMSHYLTPPPTVERPIKHWYTGDTDNEDNSLDHTDNEDNSLDHTDNEDNSPDHADNEDNSPDQSDFDDEDVPQTLSINERNPKELRRYYLRNVRHKPY